MSKIAKMYDNLSHCKSVQDMLTESETDWSAEVVEAAGTGFASGGFKAIVRPDIKAALSFVSDRYRVNDHRSQLYSLDGMVASGEIVPSSVSVWDNGAVLAYQFRCPELDISVGGKDMVSPLLTLAFAYGFPLADSAFFADFRWFCKNQMGKVGKLLTSEDRIRHRGDVQNRFADVLHRRIGELAGELRPRYELMGRMVDKALPAGRSLVEYFGESISATEEEIDQAWVGLPEDLEGNAAKIPEILDCYAQDDCDAPGTVWHAYNAVTRYHSHGSRVVKRGRKANDINTARSILLGDKGKIVANAYDVAARMVG